MTTTSPNTVGIDLGDTHSYICTLDTPTGDILEQTRIRTTPKALKHHFSKRPQARVALETSTHSPGVSRLIKDSGHDMLVANARHVRLVYQNHRKNDQLDAENLARLARLDPKLLHPIRHRSEKAQADLAVIRSRHALVAARTQLINHARGVAKAIGVRLPKCGTNAFDKKVRPAIPDMLKPALDSIVEAIATLNTEIRKLEVRIGELSNHYPETKLLRQIPSVGPITSLAFILNLEDHTRFDKSRSVGAFLGLVPSRAQSGHQDPLRGISKAGDTLLRMLLVQCAQILIQDRRPDSDLKRFGHKLLARGGKGARAKAVTAVAQKLSVLMHRLWVTGEVYDPLRNTQPASLTIPAASS